jgi:1,4-dihydroxy-2-naphthoate octaprenyltransferase
MDFRITRFFFHITRPLDLLGGVLVYALGVGIARYLGSPIDWVVISLGQVWVTTYQIGFHFLAAYFLLPIKPGDRNRLPISDEGEENPTEIRRDLVLWAAFAAFAATTSLTLILMVSNGVNGSILILQGLLMLGAILYCVPPFRLIYSGYGELIRSIIMANLIPAFAFMLQYGDIHRLVGMSTFPLTTLHLAMLLAVQLPGYYTDIKNNHETLLVRLGWARGMIFHNLLILSAFLVVGIAMLFGLPAPVALPIFFVLPLGLFQIWYMTRIAGGAKPNWRVLSLTATLTFGLTAYLFAFTFWVR